MKLAVKKHNFHVILSYPWRCLVLEFKVYCVHITNSLDIWLNLRSSGFDWVIAILINRIVINTHGCSCGVSVNSRSLWLLEYFLICLIKEEMMWFGVIVLIGISLRFKLVFVLDLLNFWLLEAGVVVVYIHSPFKIPWIIDYINPSDFVLYEIFKKLKAGI